VLFVETNEIYKGLPLSFREALLLKKLFSYFCTSTHLLLKTDSYSPAEDFSGTGNNLFYRIASVKWDKNYVICLEDMEISVLPRCFISLFTSGLKRSEMIFNISGSETMKSQPLNVLDELMSEEELEQAKVKAESMLFELNLAELRHLAQKSKTEVAEIMGVKQPTVANLEKNGKDVKLLSLKRYVEALGGKLTLKIELSDGSHRGLDI